MLNFATNFLCLGSFSAQTMLIMQISTSNWSLQHPNAGQNMQQISLKNENVIIQKGHNPNNANEGRGEYAKIAKLV